MRFIMPKHMLIPRSAPGQVADNVALQVSHSKQRRHVIKAHVKLFPLDIVVRVLLAHHVAQSASQLCFELVIFTRNAVGQGHVCLLDVVEVNIDSASVVVPHLLAL